MLTFPYRVVCSLAFTRFLLVRLLLLAFSLMVSRAACICLHLQQALVRPLGGLYIMKRLGFEVKNSSFHLQVFVQCNLDFTVRFISLFGWISLHFVEFRCFALAFRVHRRKATHWCWTSPTWRCSKPSCRDSPSPKPPQVLPLGFCFCSFLSLYFCFSWFRQAPACV